MCMHVYYIWSGVEIAFYLTYRLYLVLTVMYDVFLSRSANAQDDGDYRIHTSLSSIDPRVDNLLLEQEVKRLNESFGGKLKLM